MNEQEKKYWAFISYSHQDKKWGDWLHKKLETYKIPKTLIASAEAGKVIPKRIYPIFRDREELPSAADLSENINQALRQSKYLIVICSPRSAKSLWVNEEVKAFKALNNNNRVLCLIVDGEPNASSKPELKLDECFPEAIKYKITSSGGVTTERVEPIAADARKGKDGKRDALLKIIAGVLGVNYDALKQRDQVRQVRRLQVLSISVLILMGIFSFLGFGFYQAKIEAEQQKLATVVETRKANHNLGLVFAKRASVADIEKNQTRALFFSLVALDNMNEALDKNKREVLLRIANKARYKKSLTIAPGTQHDEPIYSITLSRNGYKLATSTLQKIRIWDVKSGALLNEINTGVELKHMMFASDDKKLISIDLYGPIRIWDVGSGEQLNNFLLGNIRLSSVISLYGKNKLLIADESNLSVYTLDIESGEILKILQGDGRSSDNLLLSPTGNVLAYLREGLVSLIDVSSGEIFKVYSQKFARIRSLSFSHNEKILAIAENNNLYLLDVVGAEQTKVLNFPEDIVDGGRSGISFSNDDEFVVSEGFSKVIYRWNIRSGKLENEFKGHTHSISAHVFSKDSKRLFSSSYDKSIIIWDLKLGLGSQNKGHSSAVTDVIFTAKNRHLITAGANNEIYIWDSITGKHIKTLKGHSEPVRALSISMDSQLLASVGNDHTVRIWNIEEGKNKFEFELNSHHNDVVDVAFSPVSKWTLATASFDDTVKIWNIATGKVLHTLYGHSLPVISISFSPDGKVLASVGRDSKIILWNVRTGKKIKELNEADTKSIAFSPNGKLLAFADKVKGIQLWNVKSGKIRNFNVEKLEDVNSIKFSPDGQMLVFAGINKIIYLADVTSGSILAILEGHLGEVNKVRFSNDGKTLASAGSNGEIQLWDLMSVHNVLPLNVGKGRGINANDKTIITASTDGIIGFWDIASRRYFNSFKASPNNIKLSPSGEIIASIFKTPRSVKKVSVRFNDVTTGRYLGMLSENFDWISQVKFTKNGRFLFLMASSIGKWEVGGLGRRVESYRPFRDPEFTNIGNYSSIFSPNAEYVLHTSFMDYKVYSAKLTPNASVNSSDSLKDTVTQVAFSPSGKYFASTGYDQRVINLRETSTGNLLRTINGHYEDVKMMTISPDGVLLATASESGFVRVFDTDTGALLYVLKNKGGSINDLAFSPDGTMITAAVSDNTIRLWNSHSGEMMTVLGGHTGPINEVSFSGNNFLISSGGDGFIGFWKISEAIFKESPTADRVNRIYQESGLFFKHGKLNIKPSVNLFFNKNTKTFWSNFHPFHWLPKAEQGDGQSMIELGNIYLRDDNIVQAKYWFSKAQMLEEFKVSATERLLMTDKIVKHAYKKSH